MKFGPDGYLYVASRARNAILKLDPRTGQFIQSIGTIPSPAGIAFLYKKTCQVDGLESVIVLFEILVTSVSEHSYVSH